MPHPNTINRRRFQQLALGTVAGLTSACSSRRASHLNSLITREPPQREISESRPLSRLRVGCMLRPVLDLRQIDDPSDALWISPIFETLTRLDHNNQLHPGLAIRWQHTPNRLSYILTLRSQRLFSDGTPCTSAHVTERLNRWAQAHREHHRFPSASWWKQAEPIDDNTIRIQLTQPSISLPYDLAHLSAAIGKKASTLPARSRISSDALRSSEATNGMIGTGPFTLVHFDNAERAILRRIVRPQDTVFNPQAVQELIFIEGSDTDILNAIAADRIDLAPVLPLESRDLLHYASTLRIQQTASSAMLTCIANLGPDVREGLALRRTLRANVKTESIQQALDLEDSQRENELLITSEQADVPSRFMANVRNNLARPRVSLSPAGSAQPVTVYPQTPNIPLLNRSSQILITQWQQQGFNVAGSYAFQARSDSRSRTDISVSLIRHSPLAAIRLYDLLAIHEQASTFMPSYFWDLTTSALGSPTPEARLESLEQALTTLFDSALIFHVLTLKHTVAVGANVRNVQANPNHHYDWEKIEIPPTNTSSLWI